MRNSAICERAAREIEAMTNGEEPAARDAGRPGRRRGARRAYRRLRPRAGGLRRRVQRRGRARPGGGGPSPCSTSRSPFSSRSACGRTCEPLAAPLRALRLIDDTGALFPPAAGRIPGGGNRARRLRLEYRERPDGRGARRRDRRSFRRRARPGRGRGIRFRRRRRPRAAGRTGARSRPGSRSARTGAIRRRGAPPGSKRGFIAIRRAR